MIGQNTQNRQFNVKGGKISSKLKKIVKIETFGRIVSK